MNHFYRLPASSPASDIIQYCWEVQHRYPQPVRERILPKGTLELMFHFDGSARREVAGAPQIVSRCFLNGFNSQPLSVQLAGAHHLFGIVLQPAASRSLLRTPALEFADACLDATLLDPYFDQLWHRLAAAANFADRVALGCSWLLGRSAELSPRERALNNFLTDDRNLLWTVDGLSKHLCYSTRQTARQLRALTGRNTEETLLFRKYLHALNQVHSSDDSLTAIAYESGFSDQAHFIRTFRASTGMTPGAYRRRRSHLPGHLFEDVR